MYVWVECVNMLNLGVCSYFFTFSIYRRLVVERMTGILIPGGKAMFFQSPFLLCQNKHQWHFSSG